MAEVKLATGWKDFSLLSTGNGEKEEQWGEYILRRPEPQAVWPHDGSWQKAHAVYHRSSSGGGHWEHLKDMPERWVIGYRNLRFNVETMGFKHTGLFPEQSVNWDFMEDRIKNANREINVLNLFAYTGGATAACAGAGAAVCHVDSAKGMVARAKENLALSGLSEKPVRFIVDDARKFVQREIRRERKYDGILMDPPAYGRGPSGELWKIEDELYGLVELCSELLSDNPVFFLVSTYASTITPLLMENILNMILVKNKGGSVETYELGLKSRYNGIVLPCGFTGRWVP
ncbi:MAG TPA: class I SAM-dependent methyltransferase [Clostridia bacterium]|mgnify:CR=1 FL=1|nr:class I SAM-dependent methyltransferase [Clostridia bacterium]